MNQSSVASALHPVMVIETATDLGEDAILNPKKYNGFMGISVGHKYFSKQTMENFFIWGSQTFKEFVVVLLDDPDKYNFMVFENLSPEDALAKARIIGDERARAFEKVIRKIDVSNVKIMCSRNFCNAPKFKKMLETTHSYAHTDIIFKKELYGLMEYSIGNKIKQLQHDRLLSHIEITKIRDILSDYIIEEFATLLYFTETGYQIEVDPTKEFSTKRFVYEGKFDEFKNILSLTQRGHIYAHPEGMIKSTY